MTLPLGEVVVATPTTDPSRRPSESFEYIDVSSVSNETLRIESTQTLLGKGAPSRARKLVATNDVLFATIRPTLRRVAIVPAELNGQVCSTGYIVLRAGDRIDYRWIIYFLQTPFFMERMESLQRGASYPAVTDGDVRGVMLPIPPLPEQHRIVALLDEAFEGISKAKENAQANVDNSQGLRKSVRSEVFDRRDGDWQEVTLDKISENLDSKRVPITKGNREVGPFPYYGASGIVDYVSGFIFDEETLLVSEDGANLISRTTPIAFPASGKYWVNNHAHILRFKSRVTQRFVEEYIESISIEGYVTGAAQPKLTQRALNAIPIPLPTSEQRQSELLDELDSVRSASERLHDVQTRKLAALDELKKSLLHHAFAGEL